MLIKLFESFSRDIGEVRRHVVGRISASFWVFVFERDLVEQANFSQDVVGVVFQCFVMPDEVVVSLAWLTELVGRPPVRFDGPFLYSGVENILNKLVERDRSSRWRTAISSLYHAGDSSKRASRPAYTTECMYRIVSCNRIQGGAQRVCI